MTTRAHRWTDWLCLAIGLFLSLAPTQRMVFCVDPGGSFAIEFTRDGECGGCCADKRDTPATDDSSTPRLAADCDCVDVPVTLNTATVIVKAGACERAYDSPARIPAPLALLPSGDRLVAAECVRHAEDARPARLHDVLRSTVLLV